MSSKTPPPNATSYSPSLADGIIPKILPLNVISYPSSFVVGMSPKTPPLNATSYLPSFAVRISPKKYTICIFFPFCEWRRYSVIFALCFECDQCVHWESTLGTGLHWEECISVVGGLAGDSWETARCRKLKQRGEVTAGTVYF